MILLSRITRSLFVNHLHTRGISNSQSSFNIICPSRTPLLFTSQISKINNATKLIHSNFVTLSSIVTSMSKVVDEIKKVNEKIDEVEGEIKKLPDIKDLNEEDKRYIRKKEEDLRKEKEDLRKEKEDLRKKEEFLLDDLRKEKANKADDTVSIPNVLPGTYSLYISIHIPCTNIYLFNNLVIHVPSEFYPFTRGIEETVNFPAGIIEINDATTLVDVENSIQEAVEIIKIEIPQATSEVGIFRKSPLFITRLSRGGKTTLLMKIFDALKLLKLNPLIITFNGKSKFLLSNGESQSEAILRLIASQLLGDDILFQLSHSRIVCDEEALDKYIGCKPFVLLVDELNSLAYPIDLEAGNLLKRMFIDKRNRYFVSTSHIPFPPDLSGYIEGSTREIKRIHLPISNDLKSLRKISPKCESLTGAEVMYCGAIPSLIYCYKIGIDFDQRFNGIKKKISIDAVYFAAFLEEFMYGRKNSFNINLNSFYWFSSVDKNGDILWPLCYAKHIFGVFRKLKYVPLLVNLIKDFEIECKFTKSGRDWEKLVQIAFITQFLNARYRQDEVPLFGSLEIPHDDLKDLKLIIEYLGPETENLDTANKVMETFVADLGSHKALILFLPSSAVFCTFDGFVVYGRGDSTMSKIAFQTKTGNTYPKKIPSKFLLHFMLFYLFIILLHHFKI